MCNVTVSYFERDQKVHSNERQMRSEQAGTSRSERVYQIMRGAIRVEQIRYGASISQHIELRGMIRLEKSGVKTSEEKTHQIGAEQEHHGEREQSFQKIIENGSEKIRAEGEKNSVQHSRSSSVVQKNTEQEEDMIGKCRQITVTN